MLHVYACKLFVLLNLVESRHSCLALERLDLMLGSTKLRYEVGRGQFGLITTLKPVLWKECRDSYGNNPRFYVLRMCGVSQVSALEQSYGKLVCFRCGDYLSSAM